MWQLPIYYLCRQDLLTPTKNNQDVCSKISIIYVSMYLSTSIPLMNSLCLIKLSPLSYPISASQFAKLSVFSYLSLPPRGCCTSGRDSGPLIVLDDFLIMTSLIRGPFVEFIIVPEALQHPHDWKEPQMSCSAPSTPLNYRDFSEYAKAIIVQSSCIILIH